mgnify:CR=1 FL=1
MENFETVIFFTKTRLSVKTRTGITAWERGFQLVSEGGFPRFSTAFGERMWKNKNPYEQKRCWPITVITGREKIHWFVDLAGL